MLRICWVCGVMGSVAVKGWPAMSEMLGFSRTVVEKIRISISEVESAHGSTRGSLVRSRGKWSARWPVKDRTVAEVAKSYDLVPQTVGSWVKK